MSNYSNLYCCFTIATNCYYLLLKIKLFHKINSFTVYEKCRLSYCGSYSVIKLQKIYLRNKSNHTNKHKSIAIYLFSKKNLKDRQIYSKNIRKNYNIFNMFKKKFITKFFKINQVLKFFFHMPWLPKINIPIYRVNSVKITCYINYVN